MTSYDTFQQDERIRWIRQRVSLTLDIPTVTFDEYFSNTNGDYIKAKENIISFFSNQYSAGSTIFFANNQWNEVIEGNIHLSISTYLF